jgi:hypothetical protein
MLPGGFRYTCACLKARHVTSRQRPRLRLYTRPMRLHSPAQARWRARKPHLSYLSGPAGMPTIGSFSWEAIAKRGK